jgi:hypothetical protein
MVSLRLYFLDAHYYHDDYRVHLARVLSSAPPVSFWFRVLLLIFNDETTQLPYFSLSDFIYPQAFLVLHLQPKFHKLTVLIQGYAGP